MNAPSFRALWIPAIVGVALFGCGETPPPANPSSGELPLVVPTGKPAELTPATAEPVASAEPSAVPSASAAPSAAASAPPANNFGCNRPPLVKSDTEEVSGTFGSSPCAKLEVGPEGETGVFRIPENALQTGVNVTFKIDNKAKAAGQQVGRIFHVSAVIPPSGTPEKVVSGGPPFIVQLPAGSKKDANLAVGEITPAKIVWKVIAPVKIDDVTNIATYELSEISDNYLHVTTRPVTTPK